LIFDVKGLVHPPDRIIAYLRYVPDGRGGRKRAGVKYRKVYQLDARAELLARKWPKYLYYDPFLQRKLQGVPINDVKHQYLPSKKLAKMRRATKLDRRERLADIDLILQGSDAAMKCYSKLKEMLERRAHGFAPYVKNDLRKLYRQRSLSAAMSFGVFAKHEQPKVLQGKYKGTDYFIRCVMSPNEWDETYGDRRYHRASRASIHATISDDSESIFTPCTYRIVDVHITGNYTPPSEIVSFRGRFCEQTRRGDRVWAKGVLEKVVAKDIENYRLVIGEKPQDFLVTVGKSKV
jgi:predicted nucleotidyltransferase